VFFTGASLTTSGAFNNYTLNYATKKLMYTPRAPRKI